MTAGTTNRAATSSAPTTERVAVVASAIRPSSAASCSRRSQRAAGARDRSPWASQRRPSRPWRAASPAAAPTARAMSEPSIRSRLPKSRVSTLAPEPKTSLARITPPARQPTRTSATTLSRPSSRPRPSAALPAVNRRAAPKAPSGAPKPRPSARTRPGNAAVPTACEKKARPRSTIQVPSRPAGIARTRISISPRWTNGSWNGLEHGGELNENESNSCLPSCIFSRNGLTNCARGGEQ